jgi:hypothetical protein
MRTRAEVLPEKHGGTPTKPYIFGLAGHRYIRENDSGGLGT